jgi:hypothetical protein
VKNFAKLCSKQTGAPDRADYAVFYVSRKEKSYAEGRQMQPSPAHAVVGVSDERL